MLTGESGLFELDGLGVMMLSLDTLNARELPFTSLVDSPTEMPGTERFVDPATRGRALAVETAPVASTPMLSAEAAPMATQFFVSMRSPFVVR